MNWTHIFSIIEEDWEHSQRPGILGALIDPTPFSSRQAAKDALVEAERRHCEAIDQACFQFARMRRWPALDSEQMLQLFARMKQALDLLRFFETGTRDLLQIVPPPDEEIPDSEILEYLLVYYWHHIGRERHLASQTLHL